MNPTKAKINATKKAILIPLNIPSPAACWALPTLMMVTRSAVKMEAPTVRMVLCMAVPWAIRSRRNELMPAVIKGMDNKAKPSIWMVNIMEMAANGVCWSMKLYKIVASTIQQNPILPNPFMPKRSNNFPEIGDIAPVMIAPGKSINPE